MTATYKASARIELDSLPDLDRGIVFVKFGKDEIITGDVYHVRRYLGLWGSVIEAMLWYGKVGLSVDAGGMRLSKKKNGKAQMTLHIDSFKDEVVDLDDDGLRHLLDLMAEEWGWADPAKAESTEEGGE